MTRKTLLLYANGSQEKHTGKNGTGRHLKEGFYRGSHASMPMQKACGKEFFLNVLAQTPLLSQHAGTMEYAHIHHASHSPHAAHNGRQLNEEVRKGATLVLVLDTKGGELIENKHTRKQLPVLVRIARPEEFCHRVLLQRTEEQRKEQRGGQTTCDKRGQSQE